MTRGLLLVLAACSATPQAASSPPRVTPSDAGVVDGAAKAECDGKPPTTAPLVVRVEHYGCDGKCPGYWVAVYRDGTIEYVGRANVAVAGRRVTHVDVAAVEELAHGFAAIGFSTLPDYTSPKYPGGPTANVEVGTAVVLVAWGDPRIPPALTALEDKIDALAGVAPGRESAHYPGPCAARPTVLVGRIIQATVDGGVVRLVIGIGETQGITRAWKAQLVAPDTNQLVPGELTIAEIHERTLVVTVAGTVAPASTRVRFWNPAER